MDKDQITDDSRAKATGAGMARQAVMAKMLRQQQLNNQIAQAEAGVQPTPNGMGAAPMQMPPPEMSQPQFSGYSSAPGQSGGRPDSRQQQALAEMLRRRDSQFPQ